MIISQLQYACSRCLIAWPKPLTIFLKDKGLSVKGLDLLHDLGVTMSHSWTVQALGKIAQNAMAEVRSLVQTHPFWLAYDNINWAFEVYEQRLINQSHFDSGIAASIFLQLF